MINSSYTTSTADENKMGTWKFDDIDNIASQRESGCPGVDFCPLTLGKYEPNCKLRI